MKNSIYFLCLSFFCYHLPVFAISEERAAALKDLALLGLDELQEVDVKLDDVFDIFGALVRDQEISIATGEKQNASVAPAITSVITAQDIEAMGARTLEDALRSVPGLHVTFDPRTGYTALYAVRGLLSGIGPEILVMIDNMPIKALNTGGSGRGWSGMPVNSIARIEVIRGPGSAVYGADAFSGVINVITKKAADIDGGEVGARVGRYNTHEAWLLYGKQHGEMDIAASINVVDSDGFAGVLESDAQTFYDKRDGTQASHAPGVVHTDKQNYDIGLNLGYRGWHLHGLYQQRTLGQGMGDTLPSPQSALEHLDETRFALNLDKQWQVNADWQIETKLSYFQREFDSGIYTSFPKGSLSYPNGMFNHWKVKQINSRAETSAFYRGFDNHSLRFGGGYVHEDFSEFQWFANTGQDANGNPIPSNSPLLDLSDTPAAALPEMARKNWFVYVQDTWRFAQGWSVTGGLRYDDYSDFGGTLNPRFALVHQFNERLTSKLLYGSAFRAPSLGEQHLKNTGVILGNPNLQPETIDTLELALNYRINNGLYLNANIFSYRAKDKIIRQPQIINDTFFVVFQNGGKQTGKGFETELRWKINTKTSLLANYAYVSTEDQSDNSIARIPHQTAYLRADRLLGDHWFIDAQLNWVTQFKRTNTDTRQPVKDYTTVDLTLRYKGMKDTPFDFALGIRNLFDTDIRHPTDYNPGGPGYSEHDFPVSEREWFVEGRYRF